MKNDRISKNLSALHLPQRENQGKDCAALSYPFVTDVIGFLFQVLMILQAVSIQ